MKRKYIVALALVSVLSISLFSACGSDNTSVSEESTSLTGELPKDVEDKAETEDQETDSEDKSDSEEVTEETEEENVTEAVAEEENAEEVINYSYTDFSEVMYATTTVNIRNKPSKTGDRVGILCENNEILVTGQCNETKWYRLDFNGNVGYVSYDFLTNEKPETEETVTDETSEDEAGAETDEALLPETEGGEADDVASSEQESDPTDTEV